MDLRASDAEREHTAEALREAAGEGRLTTDELEERLSAAYAATQRSELATLTADVAVVSEERVPVRSGDDGAGWIVSVMSGSTRTGRWKLSSRVRVIDLMGGSDLDLNEAEFATDVVELRVLSIMGGSTIYLPDHLNVEVSEFNLMGGNDVRVGEARPDPGGPTLRLRLVAIMGGTKVRRGRKRSWRQWRAERRGPKPPHRLHP